MIVTYDIVVDFRTQRYHSIDLAQQYRCELQHRDSETDQLHVYKVLKII